MVNRVADKESAKSILKHNGNQAAMIGMEILYTIISTLTVTSMMAAFSAAAARIYGATLVSLVLSIINDLSRVSIWGYYSPRMAFSPLQYCYHVCPYIPHSFFRNCAADSHFLPWSQKQIAAPSYPDSRFPSASFSRCLSESRDLLQ